MSKAKKRRERRKKEFEATERALAAAQRRGQKKSPLNGAPVGRATKRKQHKIAKKLWKEYYDSIEFIKHL